MTEKNSNNEIDLIVLFKLISRKINTLLIIWPANIFITILNFIFWAIYIIKKKYLVLIFSLIIGSLIGYSYQKKIYVPRYKTTLTVSPNFGSTYLLYENIKFYNNLIEQKDFEKLINHLNVDSSEAKTLLSISIAPHINESLKLINYQNLLNNADSITALTLSYDAFANKIPFDNYSLHVITLELSTNKVPSSLENSIIIAPLNNKYYTNRHNAYLENLKTKKEYIEASFKKLDLLLISKNKKDEQDLSGATIVLDENQPQEVEVKLFDRYTLLRNELVNINYELEDKKNLINIIDSFKEIGKLKNKKEFQLISSLFAFIIAIFVILFLEISKKLTLNSLFILNKLPYKTD